MAQKSKLQGYEEFRKFADQIQGDGNVTFYFTGSKNEEGQSWCPDCVVAQPFIFEAVEKHCQEGSSFVTVEVGDRTFWKDQKNPFRLDKDVHLSVLPSLVRWKSPLRLENDQCEKPDLLEMFFTEEE